MTTSTNQQRLPILDIMNVLFVGIVLLLHFDDYTLPFLNSFPLLGVWLAHLSVGGFFFLSGIKLALNKSNESFAAFWRGRLLRLWPLYMLAVFAFALTVQVGRVNAGVMTMHLLGLQEILPGLFGPNFLTLYFVGLLTVYYLYFSLIKHQVGRIRNFLLLSGAVILIAYGIHVWHPGDIQIFRDGFFLYFPFFVFGLLTGRDRDQLLGRRVLNPWLLGALSVITVPLSMFLSLFILFEDPRVLFFRVPVVALSALPIYYILLRVGWGIKRVPRLVQNLSAGGFAIYLFHRPIWTVMENIYPEHLIWQWIYIALGGTFIILLVGYHIQRLYDRLSARWITKTP